MATSEERREVAARMRMCAKTTNGTRDFNMCLSHWVGIDGVTDDKGNLFSIQADRREAELTLERLADLIDPTCTAPLGEHEHGWLTRECSECGYTIKTGDRYCPGCGARLVSE